MQSFTWRMILLKLTQENTTLEKLDISLDKRGKYIKDGEYYIHTVIPVLSHQSRSEISDLAEPIDSDIAECLIEKGIVGLISQDQNCTVYGLTPWARDGVKIQNRKRLADGK